MIYLKGKEQEMETKILLTKLGGLNLKNNIQQENQMLTRYKQEGYKITHTNMTVDNNNMWIFYLLEKD